MFRTPHPLVTRRPARNRPAPRHHTARATPAACATVLLVAALSWSPSAQALQAVRDAVTRAAPIPCTPECTLCHNPPPGASPGKDNMTQPFGLALRDVGKIDIFDPDGTVAAALQNLETAKVDSDQDGMLDVDELRAGDNPNPNPNKVKASLCGGGELVPTYGCGARIAPVAEPAGTSVPLVTAGLVALALLVNWRARRRGH